MAKYFVTFQPIEPYTFASETAFSGEFESKSNNQPTYFLGTKQVPEQTTVFGTVRYLVLKAAGRLKADYDYDEKDNIAALIGDKSFSFEEKGQSFGAIQAISPVFVVDSNDQVLIRNPLCNKSKGKGFDPFTMVRIPSSLGEGAHLPARKEYDAKQYLQAGFVYAKNLQDTETDIFIKQTLTGNAIQKEQDGFYKREVMVLQKGYAFAIMVTMDDKAAVQLDKESGTIVYMGKRKSAFLTTIKKVERDVLSEAIAEIGGKAAGVKNHGSVATVADTANSGQWYYAVSDVVLSKKGYQDFAVVETKSIRNLTTQYGKRDQKGRLQRSDKQYNLVSAGSVFYGFDPNEELVKESGEQLLRHLQQIGLNHIVAL